MIWVIVRNPEFLKSIMWMKINERNEASRLRSKIPYFYIPGEFEFEFSFCELKKTVNQTRHKMTQFVFVSILYQSLQSTSHGAEE